MTTNREGCRIKIDCISDLHGEEPVLKGGDLLIIAGDLTGSNQVQQYKRFNEWLGEIAHLYNKVIVIAGNHDGCIEARHVDASKFNCVYLQDSGCEYAGLKIWGSPWTPNFCQWYFMKARGEAIAEVWAKIPKDTDILVTHGPPWGILDYVKKGSSIGHFCGCIDLYDHLRDLKKLKLHVFGHIHYSYGLIPYAQDFPGVKFVNASVLNEDYEMVNDPITVYL